MKTQGSACFGGILGVMDCSSVGVDAQFRALGSLGF